MLLKISIGGVQMIIQHLAARKGDEQPQSLDITQRILIIFLCQP